MAYTADSDIQPNLTTSKDPRYNYDWYQDASLLRKSGKTPEELKAFQDWYYGANPEDLNSAFGWDADYSQDQLNQSDRNIDFVFDQNYDTWQNYQNYINQNAFDPTQTYPDPPPVIDDEDDEDDEDDKPPGGEFGGTGIFTGLEEFLSGLQDASGSDTYTADGQIWTGQSIPDALYDAQGRKIWDFTDLKNTTEELTNYSIPDFSQWLDDNGLSYTPTQETDAYQGLQGLTATDEAGNYTNPQMQNLASMIEQLSAGPSGADQNGAKDYAASMMGISADDYAGMTGDMTNALAGGIEGMGGMSEEETAMRERYNQRMIEDMEDRATKTLEGIYASTGSVNRYLMNADSALSQIGDAQLQNSVALADEQYQRKVQQFESMQSQLQTMVQNQQISSSEYLNLLSENRAQALTAYASQISQVMAGYESQIGAIQGENAQLVSMYNADLNAMQTHIDQMYNAVNIEMGLQDHVLSTVNELFEARYAEQIKQLEIDLMSANVEALEAAMKQGNGSTIIEAIGTAIKIATDVAALL